MALMNIAHRGFSGKYPENTMMAFAKAIDEGGCDGIETDVHLSLDGELVLIHDDTLERTTSGIGLVSEKPISYLRSLNAGRGETIPLLSELLELARAKNIIVNIELKNDEIPAPGLEKKVIELVDDMNMRDRVMLSSFNHDSMALAKTIAPTVYTGLLYSRPTRKAWLHAKKLHANALNPHYKIARYQIGLARNCRKFGIDINAWTVNEERDMMRLLHSVSSGSIITNYPDRLSAILEK